MDGKEKEKEEEAEEEKGRRPLSKLYKNRPPC